MRASAPLARFLAFALLLISASPSPAADLSGLTITGIRFVDDRGAAWPHPEQLLPLALVRTGSPLSREEVRRGIEYLYVKGSFRDVRVEGYPDGDGVRLEYVLSPLTTIGGIAVRGNDALSTGTIKGLARRLEGKEPLDEKLAKLREEIIDRYRAEGYYDAEVDLRLEPGDAPSRVILAVEVREGGRAVIRELRFTGIKAMSEKELLRIMKSRPGGPYQRVLLRDRDLAAVRSAYQERGYPAAHTGPVNVRFRGDGVHLEVEVTEGQRVETVFSGNREFSDADLSGLLLIREEHEVSDAIIESSAHRITRAYQEAGYIDAAVDVRKTSTPDLLRLEFAVQEGKRVTVEDVRFEGNSALSRKKLLKGLALTTGGWFRSAPFRADLVNDARDAIRSRYVEAGYRDAQVEPIVKRSDDGARASIVFRITEGRRLLVLRIVLAGNQAIDGSVLRGLLGLRPGGPFSEQAMDEDKYRILGAYAAAGHLSAQVDAGSEESDGAVTVTFTIAEGRRVSIGKIILRGNERTEDRTILRELSVKEGDPYDYAAILKSQQQVYRLGFLGLARFEPLRPGAQEEVKDMLLTVEERNAGVVEVGVGYGNFDRLRGFAEVSYRNLWGSAKTAGFRIEGSDILQEAVLDFREPWLFGRKLEWRTRLAWSDAKRINTDTREIYYETRKTELSTGVEKVVDAAKYSFVYQFENVENYSVAPGAILSREDEGRVRVSSVTPGVIVDLRDDPFNPHAGSLHGLAVKHAAGSLGSEASFTKGTFQTSWFLPVGRSAVLALSCRAGRAWPHGETVEVPLHERFYLGGGSTVRGYQQDSVGPQAYGADGSRTPTGGDRMALVNAEIRIGRKEGLGLVLFADAGNVWLNEGIDRHDLRGSVGIGLRYQTPVGPVRIDYGQKLNRKGAASVPLSGGSLLIVPGESPGEIHINIGHSF